MTKLEKSIRREIKPFGPRLRSGHYGVPRYTVGLVPNDFRTIKTVCCDVENGEVTDIRLYCVGDAMEAHDYHGKSVNITEAVEKYLMESRDWDDLIKSIEEIVRVSVQGNYP